ncbi:TPA: deacetylase, partial [Streptococcus pyogenes]
LNVILVGLLSILMLSLAIVFINRWKLNEDSQRIVLAEKKRNTSDLVIKAVKHIKKDQKDYYYFSPI